MKIRESVLINATPADIWPFIAIPARMKSWNPRIISVSRASDSPVKLGEWFHEAWKLGSGPRDAHVEIIACERYSLVSYRHHMEVKGVMRFADEIYTLRERNRRTLLCQISDLSGAGIPWWGRIIIRLISLFGKPVEEPFLNRLKREVESTK